MEQQNEKKTRRVAVVKGAYQYDRYDDYSWIPKGGLEWMDVTEEDFVALQHFCQTHDYKIIEPVPVQDILGDARTYYKAHLKEQERMRKADEARKAANAKVIAERRAKKLQKERDEIAKKALELGLISSLPTQN